MKTTKGKFTVTGFHFLSKELRKMLSNELKTGDVVTLVPDPTNKHDSNAIKVIFKDIQIGWYEGKGYRDY